MTPVLDDLGGCRDHRRKGLVAIWLRVCRASDLSWPVRYVKPGQDEGGYADGRDEAGCGGGAATLSAPSDPPRAARAPLSRARRTEDLGQAGRPHGARRRGKQDTQARVPARRGPRGGRRHRYNRRGRAIQSRPADCRGLREVGFGVRVVPRGGRAGSSARSSAFSRAPPTQKARWKSAPRLCAERGGGRT
jgi:hypothetical protein